jgi:hypothetical protein
MLFEYEYPCGGRSMITHDNISVCNGGWETNIIRLMNTQTPKERFMYLVKKYEWALPRGPICYTCFPYKDKKERFKKFKSKFFNVKVHEPYVKLND